jgi:hypothetical protein
MKIKETCLFILIVTAFKAGALGQDFCCMDGDEFRDFICHELFTAFPLLLIVYVPDAIVQC